MANDPHYNIYIMRIHHGHRFASCQRGTVAGNAPATQLRKRRLGLLWRFLFSLSGDFIATNATYKHGVLKMRHIKMRSLLNEKHVCKRKTFALSASILVCVLRVTGNLRKARKLKKKKKHSEAESVRRS